MKARIITVTYSLLIENKDKKLAPIIHTGIHQQQKFGALGIATPTLHMHVPQCQALYTSPP